MGALLSLLALAGCGGNGSDAKGRAPHTGGSAAVGGWAMVGGSMLMGGGPTGAVAPLVGGTSGVATSGGAPTGGIGGAPTGGTTTGGAPTGGRMAGGAPMGGVATGGRETGGAATGGAPTGGVATGGVTSQCGEPVTVTYTGSAAQNQLTGIAAVEVEGGSTVSAVMTGTGDADLYVRIGSAPTATAYDCRPYEDNSNETCRVRIPQEGSTVYVMVAGYGANSYTLDFTYTPRCCKGADDCDDQNPCTTDRCEAEVCTYSDNTDPCDDDDACTEDDGCADGSCAGSALVCPNGLSCVDGECEENPALSLYTTCVEDDLSPEDRSIAVQQMTAIGYTAIGENTNVSTAALDELIGRTDITTLYHTGHGYNGMVITSDGALSHDQASIINVPNVVFATCLTLTEDWSDKMGAASNNVLGYTNYSYDQIDTQVIRDLAQALGEGKSYIRAWYTANVSQSYLSDRWCGYTREAGGVVEYSARTGNVPAASFGGALEQVDPKIWVDSDLLADARTFQSEFAPQQLYEYAVVGDEDHLVQFSSDPHEFLTKSALASEHAVQAASAWLGAKLPIDASLETPRALKAKASSGAPTTAAYRVRYERVIDGMPVLSNGRVHHIEVVVDARGVVAMSRLWPTLDVFPSRSSLPLLGVDVAFASAIDEIRMLVKEPVTIVDVMPCYGSTELGEIVAAYAFLDSEGGRIVVNARTGALVY